MKKIKYLFLLFLGLFATLDIIHADNFVEGEYTYINPEYRDLYKEKDLISHIPNVDYGNEVKYYNSADEVASYLRSEFLKGNYYLNFGYYSPVVEEEPMKAELEKIYQKAVEHTGVPNEGDYLANNSSGRSSGWTCYKTPKDGKYSCQITFYYFSFTTAEEEKELDAKIKEVLASLNLKGKTEYQKVSAIYDYITSHITYDYASLKYEETTGAVTKAHTAYNALLKNTAVCQGYALLFYRMVLEEGIDARYISGIGNGGPHAWNIVKLGKYYYNLDATWDATPNQKPYEYFLRSNANFTDHVRGNGINDQGVKSGIDYTSPEFNSKYPMGPTDYKEEAETIKGDLNGDGKVELTDVLMLLKAYFNNSSTLTNPACDLNNDGKSDLTDILMLLKVYFTNN